MLGGYKKYLLRASLIVFVCILGVRVYEVFYQGSYLASIDEQNHDLQKELKKIVVSSTTKSKGYEYVTYENIHEYVSNMKTTHTFRDEQIAEELLRYTSQFDVDFVSDDLKKAVLQANKLVVVDEKINRVISGGEGNHLRRNEDEDFHVALFCVHLQDGNCLIGAQVRRNESLIDTDSFQLKVKTSNSVFNSNYEDTASVKQLMNCNRCGRQEVLERKVSNNLREFDGVVIRYEGSPYIEYDLREMRCSRCDFEMKTKYCVANIQYSILAKEDMGMELMYKENAVFIDTIHIELSGINCVK